LGSRAATPLNTLFTPASYTLIYCSLREWFDIVNKNETLNAQLIEAAALGTVSGIQRALNFGANINGRDPCQSTALHHAAANGHAAAVDYLLKRGANLRALDNNGNIPIQIAEARGHVQIAERLRAAPGQRCRR
jgi:ankyrin repeat protein